MNSVVSYSVRQSFRGHKPMSIKLRTLKLKPFTTLIGLIICFGLIGHANAQLPQRCQEILMQAMSADGHLTRDMHEEFWGSLAQVARSEDEMRMFEQYLTKNLLYMQEYQLELYTSAQLSLDAGDIVTTSRFDKLAKGLTEHRPGQEKVAQDFLESAAYGTEISRPDGRTLIVTQEVVDSVLPNIESSFSRLQRLITKTWNDS